jgi:diaminopimelate epimerase
MAAANELVLVLTKHHGLGNDFLIVLDPPPGTDLPATARVVCDRHRGIGADGLIAAFRTGTDIGGADARMVLHNADGSRAEMSGNGIRCLAQAMVDAGWSDEARPIAIVTDAGDHVAEVGPDNGNGERSVRVSMGPAKVVRSEGDLAVVDVGNPHLVLRVDDPAAVDLEAMGSEHADSNVEVIRVDDRSNITMRVYERGVGITQACGTGSCAAAAAAFAWGLTDARMVVHNPGGPLTVEIESGDHAWLTGPTTFVGKIEVEIEIEVEVDDR